MAYHPRNAGAYHMSTSGLHKISLKQLSTVFDFSPDALLLMNLAGTIVTANEQALGFCQNSERLVLEIICEV